MFWRKKKEEKEKWPPEDDKIMAAVSKIIDATDVEMTLLNSPYIPRAVFDHDGNKLFVDWYTYSLGVKEVMINYKYPPDAYFEPIYEKCKVRIEELKKRDLEEMLESVK